MQLVRFYHNFSLSSILDKNTLFIDRIIDISCSVNGDNGLLFKVKSKEKIIISKRMLRNSLTKEID